MVTRYIDVRELWTEQKPIEISNEKYWMKLRVLTDNKTNQKYYDILGGLREKDPHVHYGFDLLGNLMFEQPRNKIQKIRKTIDSSLHGRMSDETMIIKSTPPKINFILQVIPDANSKESKISIFEISSDSPK